MFDSLILIEYKANGHPEWINKTKNKENGGKLNEKKKTKTKTIYGRRNKWMTNLSI